MVIPKVILLGLPLCLVGQERGVSEEEVFVPEDHHDGIDWERVRRYLFVIFWATFVTSVAILAVLSFVAIMWRTRRRRRGRLTNIYNGSIIVLCQ